jgi:alpha-tubulin suppressor-like RCC1 family protein
LTGQLFACCGNTSGQLGQGNTTTVVSPLAVPGMTNTAIALAAGAGGATFSSPAVLALKNDGTLWFWGANTVGQSGDSVAIGSSVPVLVSIPATIKSIAAGGIMSMALDTNGNVWGWGDNRSFALGSSGVGGSTPALISGAAGVHAIAAGTGHALYLMPDGTLRKTGTQVPFGGSPTFGTFMTFDGATAIAAAGGESYMLRNDGRLFGVGANSFGSLGNGTSGVSAAAASPVQGITGTVTGISAALWRAGAVTSDGKAWTWGYAPLGNGTNTNSTTAVQVSGVTDAAELSVGGGVADGAAASFVRRQGGGILAWGNSGLADAVSQNPLVPYPVAFHEPVRSVRAGNYNHLGFIVGNTGLAWGFGSYGSPSTLQATIGDGAYVPRDRPVVLLAPNGAGSVDSNDWYLDLDPASAESIPTGSTPGALGVSRLFGSDAGLSLDATVKYKSADYGKPVNNYVFALVPPEFFESAQTVAGTPSVAQIKAIAQARTKLQPRDGVSVLAQLTPTGWAFVQAQLIAYSQSVANAVGSSVNILNSFDSSQIPGGRFCIGYGENSGSMLSFGALREVLLLPGASSNLSGVPCILTGLYVDGPASSRFGSPVTFKGAVVGLQPTGTIQFTNGSGTVEGPKPMSSDNQAVSSATLTTASLPLGTHSIGGIYAGDSKNAAVASEVPVPHVVVQAPPGGTSTSLAGPTSSDVGSTATFTALVAGDSPTGSVQFKDGGNNLGDAVPLVGGVATLRVSTLSLGAHSLSATYSGNSTNAGSSSNSFTHTVYAVLTTRVSLSSSPNPSSSAQSITLITTVTGDTPPTGSVTFRDGGTTLATVGLANGVASTTVSGLSAGTHQLIAVYSGDANNQAVSSPVLIHQVALPNDLLNPPRMKGISTRMQVLTGNDVMIGGFIIGGTAPKTVAVRARGPSMRIPGTLADPVLQLVPGDGSAVLTNDDWGSAANAAALVTSGFAPTEPKEAAILVTLNPGAYTAIVSGANNTTGIAIVELYEVDHPELPTVGISTRGRVQTGDDVMIGGFIIQGDGPQTVVVRGRGPSLGIPGVLADPYLQLVPAAGGPVLANDDWQQGSNAADLQAIGLQPGHPKDAAILVTLQPGAYTAIVSGVGNTTGIAIVEVYRVAP